MDPLGVLLLCALFIIALTVGDKDDGPGPDAVEAE